MQTLCNRFLPKKAIAGKEIKSKVCTEGSWIIGGGSCGQDLVVPQPGGYTGMYQVHGSQTVKVVIEGHRAYYVYQKKCEEFKGTEDWNVEEDQLQEESSHQYGSLYRNCCKELQLPITQTLKIMPINLVQGCLMLLDGGVPQGLGVSNGQCRGGPTIHCVVPKKKGQQVSDDVGIIPGTLMTMCGLHEDYRQRFLNCKFASVWEGVSKVLFNIDIGPVTGNSFKDKHGNITFFPEHKEAEQDFKSVLERLVPQFKSLSLQTDKQERGKNKKRTRQLQPSSSSEDEAEQQRRKKKG
jgi:hypothetical protein